MNVSEPNQNQTPFFPPVVWIGFAMSAVLHLSFLFFGRFPKAPEVTFQNEDQEIVELQNVPIQPKPKIKPPPPKPKETVKPKPVAAKQSGSSARRIFQSKAGDSKIATTTGYNKFDGDSVSGQGEGTGSALGTGKGPEGDPNGTGTAPEPEPPPPPPPEPLVKAKPISQPVAVYPESAKLAGQEGRVLIKAYIDKEGNVTKTKVLRSSGFPELDQAAQEAVMKMKFEPAHRGNEPEESTVGVPISFSLT